MSKTIVGIIGDCSCCRSSGFTSNFVKKSRQIINVSHIHFYLCMLFVVMYIICCIADISYCYAVNVGYLFSLC